MVSFGTSAHSPLIVISLILWRFLKLSTTHLKVVFGSIFFAICNASSYKSGTETGTHHCQAGQYYLYTASLTSVYSAVWCHYLSLLKALPSYLAKIVSMQSIHFFLQFPTFKCFCYISRTKSRVLFCMFYDFQFFQRQLVPLALARALRNHCNRPTWSSRLPPGIRTDL